MLCCNDCIRWYQCARQQVTMPWHLGTLLSNNNVADMNTNSECSGCLGTMGESDEATLP